MLIKSNECNPNYVASVYKLNELVDMSKSDNLVIGILNNHRIVMSKHAKMNELYVYFPVESKLSNRILSKLNLFRDRSLNEDENESGFFEKSGRVKMIKIRGEYSEGFALPLEKFLKAFSINHPVNENFDFDTLVHPDGTKELFIEKYISVQEQRKLNNEARAKGRHSSVSRMIKGQFEFHKDTENLRKNIFQINPHDPVAVTYKYHGSSFICSNVLVQRKLSWIERFKKLVRMNVQETEYDVVYSSRKVIKNNDFDDPKNNGGFYGNDAGSDIWTRAFKDHGHKIPQGYSIYGELVGWTANGSPIQKDYDYGLKQGEYDLYVYRVNHTDEHGNKTELTSSQIAEFCVQYDFKYVEVFYEGTAIDMFPDMIDDYSIHFVRSEEPDAVKDWRNKLLKKLEEVYTEKRCHMCTKKVPEEGIIVRLDVSEKWQALKLKSKSFIFFETKMLDKEDADGDGT